MKTVFMYISLILLTLVSCKSECEDGVMFFDECIDNTSNSLYKSEYKTDFCNVSFMFEISYGREKIDFKKYQFSHSHDPRVHWTLATNVKVGQPLNGGVTCEGKVQGTDLTQFYLEVPEESATSFPVTILRHDRYSFETLDSTVVMFSKI